MKWVFFKKIRVVVSLIFFLMVLLVFADHKAFLPESVVNTTLYLQFLPSALKFVNLLSIASLGFVIILLITILTGRVYCSTVCPLGTMQDIITWFTRRFEKNKKRKKRFFKFSRAYNTLRYGILIVVILMLVSGAMFTVSLLDPYSNFGRFTTNFAKPILVFFNNLLAQGLEKLGLFWIYPETLRHEALPTLIFPALMFGLVVWLSIKYGRLYCNTVCPVGAFLGFLSKFSMFRVVINADRCNHCKSCVYDCKAGCIDSKKQEIDFSRCVMCFNCFKACDQDAIRFENAWRRKEKNKELVLEDIKITDIKRRGFMAGMIAVAGWLAGFSSKPTKDSLNVKKVIKVTKPSEVPIKRDYPVSPPGSGSIRHFNNYCTACSLCVSACPNNVLQPSFFEYGFSGLMQPHMDYSSGFCNYDCKICGDICPTGAILAISTIEEKKTVQMGKAKFIKENCVVYTEHTDCGACSEHCPTKAVNMVPFEDTGLFIPEINDNICVGCGACEYPCPVRPYKAIYVDGNPEHLVAEKPKIEKLDEKINLDEGFPF